MSFFVTILREPGSTLQPGFCNLVTFRGEDVLALGDDGEVDIVVVRTRNAIDPTDTFSQWSAWSGTVPPTMVETGTFSSWSPATADSDVEFINQTRSRQDALVVASYQETRTRTIIINGEADVPPPEGPLTETRTIPESRTNLALEVENRSISNPSYIEPNPDPVDLDDIPNQLLGLTPVDLGVDPDEIIIVAQTGSNNIRTSGDNWDANDSASIVFDGSVTFLNGLSGTGANLRIDLLIVNTDRSGYLLLTSSVAALSQGFSSLSTDTVTDPQTVIFSGVVGSSVDAYAVQSINSDLRDWVTIQQNT